MKIGNHDIKPILLYLPDEDIWRKEYEEATIYLAEQGVTDIEHIAGVHAEKWGITGRHIYLLDNRPEEQFYIGDNKVGGFISHYILYCCMNVMPYDTFMVLEGDCRFEYPDWKDRLAKALDDVPDDWDFLFVGSCCAEDKQPTNIKGDVFHYPYRGAEKWDWYPQGGWCYLVKKRVMPLLIQTQRSINPVDVSLIKYSFPNLNVYAILPRLANQGDKTFVSP